MKINELKQFLMPACKSSRVKRLELFGSRARSSGEKGDDYDFAVEFEDMPPEEYSKSFFSFLHYLEDNLQSPIDLLTKASIRKNSLKQKIEKEGICLYES